MDVNQTATLDSHSQHGHKETATSFSRDFPPFILQDLSEAVSPQLKLF